MDSDCESEPISQFEELAKSAVYEWAWDALFTSPRLELSNQNLEVKFHPGYSTGTSAVRGSQSMSKGRHHYWEIKMITPIYGTDVMIGVGTSNADLNAGTTFCSLLGRDRESWGFSYKGYIQHDGTCCEYSSGFGQGSFVGIHLDTWKGTLQFFLNREPLGIAYSGLRNVQLYPMACSTAAQSKMRITYSCSVPASLQMDCLGLLRPLQRAYLNYAFPGLRHLSQSIFADILQRQPSNEDDEDQWEFLDQYTILDDFDFALIGCKRKQRKRLDNNVAIQEWPKSILEQ